MSKAVRLPEECESETTAFELIEKILDLARQINLEVDSDDVQELLDSNKLLRADGLIEMHEKEQDVKRTAGFQQSLRPDWLIEMQERDIKNGLITTSS
ncbi:hypothetical protein TNCV_1690091 [Trichonephila clavipes]|nr:hypothetical protein TNCV_1690091 [Trichonephila clavipes]